MTRTLVEREAPVVTGAEGGLIVVDALRNEYASPHGTVHAVQGVSFRVEPGNFYTLLGPSGCGKTTTLRSIAGLETPVSGCIQLGERMVFDGARNVNIPVHARGMGMVFQSYAIWPHMTVFDNVAYPLRYSKSKRIPRSQVSERVHHVLELVQMSAMSNRKATALSGGQQQRVALARAVVHSPDVLLLDEPLSNLDAQLRKDMRVELKGMVEELGTTVIYVTHDQVEALAMSDRIAVMDGGKIIQEGAPPELYRSPVNRFVASFVGEMNLLKGQRDRGSHRDDAYLINTSAGPLWCTPVNGPDPYFDRSGSIDIAIRPEDITVGSGPAQTDPAINRLEGVLTSKSYLGEMIDLRVQVGEASLQVHVHPNLSVPMEGDAIRLEVAVASTLALRSRRGGSGPA